MLNIWKRFERFVSVIGYARAAAALVDMGRVEEARRLMLERDRLTKSET